MCNWIYLFTWTKNIDLFCLQDHQPVQKTLEDQSQQVPAELWKVKTAHPIVNVPNKTDNNPSRKSVDKTVEIATPKPHSTAQNKTSQLGETTNVHTNLSAEMTDDKARMQILQNGDDYNELNTNVKNNHNMDSEVAKPAQEEGVVNSNVKTHLGRHLSDKDMVYKILLNILAKREQDGNQLPPQETIREIYETVYAMTQGETRGIADTWWGGGGPDTGQNARKAALPHPSSKKVSEQEKDRTLYKHAKSVYSWVDRAKNVSVAKATKVWLLSYQRSGSSFTGDIFEADTNGTFFIYEPLDAVYHAMYGVPHGWTVPADIFVHPNGTHR